MGVVTKLLMSTWPVYSRVNTSKQIGYHTSLISNYSIMSKCLLAHIAFVRYHLVIIARTFSKLIYTTAFKNNIYDLRMTSFAVGFKCWFCHCFTDHTRIVWSGVRWRSRACKLLVMEEFEFIFSVFLVSWWDWEAEEIWSILNRSRRSQKRWNME